MNDNPKTLIVIPARLESSRVPGKMLIKIGKYTMIQHMWRICSASKLAHKVVVATDSQKIINNIQQIGGQALLTSPHHSCGTDRVSEIARRFPNYSHIINVQGDMPLLKTQVIDKLINSFNQSPSEVITPCTPITSPDQINSLAVVKVVKSFDNHAIYFSRLPVPYNRDQKGKITYFRHIGIYGYQRKLILKFPQIKSKLEDIEKIELLRLLDNRFQIKLITTNYNETSVNTPQELKIVQEKFRQNLSTAKSISTK